MQALLIGGAVVLVLALVALAVIVKLAVKRGEAKAAEDADDTYHERRRDADEVLTEPVADEAAWIKKQMDLAEKVAAANGTVRARERLRDLQRRTGRGPG